jgi:hypothetical protein
MNNFLYDHNTTLAIKEETISLFEFRVSVYSMLHNNLIQNPSLLRIVQRSTGLNCLLNVKAVSTESGRCLGLHCPPVKVLNLADDLNGGRHRDKQLINFDRFGKPVLLLRTLASTSLADHDAQVKILQNFNFYSVTLQIVDQGEEKDNPKPSHRAIKIS